jgi:hypothetical protein
MGIKETQQKKHLFTGPKERYFGKPIYIKGTKPAAILSLPPIVPSD